MEETIYLYGFNLAGGKLKDAKSNGQLLTEVTPSTSYNWYSASAFTFDKAYSAAVSTFTSGEAYVEVNGIRSVNNLNSNDAKGDYAKTVDATATPQGNKEIYANYYNRQPNGDSSNILTDDLVLDVWEFNGGNGSASPAVLPISGKIEQPIMKINPKNGLIGFAFVNGPLYYSMPNTNNSHQYWMGSYDFFTSVALAYDSLGYSYSAAAGGDINSSSADKFQFMTSRWGVAGLAQSGSYGNTNSLRLESIGMQGDKGSTNYTYNFDKQRIKSPSFATAVHGNTTNVYLAYYDAMNGEIRFKYGATASTRSTNFGNFTDYDTNGNPYPYRHETVQLLADAPTSIWSSSANAWVETSTTGNYPGEYLSLGVISAEGSRTDDVAVFVWYDQTNMKLMYMYNTAPTTNRAGDTTAAGWSTPVAVFGDDSTAGEYCELAVDKNGGVHIAAYDGANCDLVYAYLPAAKKGAASSASDFATCVVDGNGVVGSNITIDVALNDAGKAIPRIGYYATSCVRPKMAYLADETATSYAPAGAVDDAFTGKWECTIVPTPSSVQMQSNQYNKINVGVWKNNGTVSNSTTGTTAQTRTVSGYNSTSTGSVYGNGTANAVVGYAIKVGASNDAIETAQMK